MQCTEVMSRLDAYLNDDLEGSEQRAMIAHLAGCPRCRQQAEAVDPLKMFVPLAAREQEDAIRWDGFWEGIAGRLDQRRPRRRAGRLLAWPVAARWVVAAGAVAATALLGIMLTQQGAGPAGTPSGETARLEAAATLPVDDEGLVEAIFIDRIAEALPAQLIERRGEVRGLRLTRVDEWALGSVNHYRAGGETVQATVSDLQRADQMESVIEYNLVIANGAGGGELEEIRVVSFESEQFPFGCELAPGAPRESAVAEEATEQ